MYPQSKGNPRSQLEVETDENSLVFENEPPLFYCRYGRLRANYLILEVLSPIKLARHDELVVF